MCAITCAHCRRMTNGRHTRALPESKLNTWKEQSSLPSTRTEYCISVFVYWNGINWVLRIDNWTIEIKPFECTPRHTVWISLGKNIQGHAKRCGYYLFIVFRVLRELFATEYYGALALATTNTIEKRILQLEPFGGTNKYHNNNLFVISSADLANLFRKNQWRIHVSRQLPRKWFIEVNSRTAN